MKTLERQLRHSNAERWNDKISKTGDAMIQSLQAGGNVSICKFGTVTITHDVDNRFDINLTVFLLTDAGKVQSDSGVVYFNQPRDLNGAAVFIAPVEAANIKTHRIDFDLRKIPTGISKIAVILTEDNRNNFSSVRNLKAEVRTANEVVQLTPNSFSAENGIIVLELYIRNEQAKVRAVWQGFTSGLDAICQHYGVDVEENSASSIPPQTQPSSASFFNPSGKLLEVADYRRYDSDTGSFNKYSGIAIFLCSLFLFFTSLFSLIKGSESVGVVFITSIGIVIGLRMYNSGVQTTRDYNIREATRAATGIKQDYLINSQNNTFILPNEAYPYCKLSDIDAVNKRVESSKRRESYSEHGKTKHRTVTDYIYYVQIVGSGISRDFHFKDQGVRDLLYSSLKTGIKETKDFLSRS